MPSLRPFGVAPLPGQSGRTCGCDPGAAWACDRHYDELVARIQTELEERQALDREAVEAWEGEGGLSA